MSSYMVIAALCTSLGLMVGFALGRSMEAEEQPHEESRWAVVRASDVQTITFGSTVWPKTSGVKVPDGRLVDVECKLIGLERLHWPPVEHFYKVEYKDDG